nr:hypothetical protein CFP56_24237 [Quercus suber]
MENRGDKQDLRRVKWNNAAAGDVVGDMGSFGFSEKDVSERLHSHALGPYEPDLDRNGRRPLSYCTSKEHSIVSRQRYKYLERRIGGESEKK